MIPTSNSVSTRTKCIVSGVFLGLSTISGDKLVWKLGDGVNSFVSPGKQSNMKSLGATQTMLRKFEVVSEQLYDGIGYSHGEFVLSLLSSTQIKI